MRYWEIDFLRGFGIILMLISNFVTDLQIFLNYPYSLFWHAFALLTASIFVFTSGASFYVCYSRGNIKKILKRFTKLMSLGLLITLTTATFLKVGTIYFGILHFLALAWILAIPFYRFGFFNCFFGVLFILLYPFVNSLQSDNMILLPIGITPTNFYTFDYFPIVPWFGIFLFGLTFGKVMVHRKPLDNKTSMIYSFIGASPVPPVFTAGDFIREFRACTPKSNPTGLVIQWAKHNSSLSPCQVIGKFPSSCRNSEYLNLTQPPTTRFEKRGFTSNIFIIRSICYIGRNSLKIYLIHQPIFVTLILLMFGDVNTILAFNIIHK